MDRSSMQFLHLDRKPSATFKLNGLGNAKFEVHVLTADGIAQMSVKVQTKGFKGLEALYPTTAANLIHPSLRSAGLLDVLSKREGRKILSPADTLKSMSTAGEIGALLSIYSKHADVTVDLGEEVEGAKN